MRALAVLAVLALLAGGLAFAASATLPGRGTAAGGPAEVEAEALLDRAREEVRAFGAEWDLVGLGAMEQAEASRHDFSSAPADPHVGNGLATAWHFQFTGPDGLAFVALKADGKRSGLGWTEHAPPEAPPALPAWKVGSAAALAKAREDPEIARFLDRDGLHLSLQLGLRQGAEGADAGPWWSVNGWTEASHAVAEDTTAPPSHGWTPRDALSFEVHALDGRVVRAHHDPGLAEPARPVPVPAEHVPCCPEERRGTYGGAVDVFNPVSRNQLDAPSWPGSHGRFVLTWTSTVEAVPSALEVRILGPDLEPWAVASGSASPLRLDAPDLPAGPLFAEVRAPDGEPVASASYELHMTLRVPPPPAPLGWEEQWWFSGGSLLERSRTHYLPLLTEVLELRAMLFTYGPPAATRPSYELTLLDTEGNAVAYAEGSDGTALETAALPPGEYWLKVVPVTPAGVAAPTLGGYTLDVRALHPFEAMPGDHGGH